MEKQIQSRYCFMPLCNMHNNNNNNYDDSDDHGDGGGVIICKMMNKE